MLPRGYVYVNSDKDRPEPAISMVPMGSGGAGRQPKQRSADSVAGGSATALPIVQQAAASPRQENMSASAKEYLLLGTYLVLWYATSAIWFVCERVCAIGCDRG